MPSDLYSERGISWTDCYQISHWTSFPILRYKTAPALNIHDINRRATLFIGAWGGVVVKTMRY
jgi:hypothetical protein